MQLIDLQGTAKAIQSGLFDSKINGPTQAVPVIVAIPTSEPVVKAKALRKKKETSAPVAPAPAPAGFPASVQSEPETKAKKKKQLAPSIAPAPAPVAPASVAAVSTTPATKPKLLKGSQEAKDHMAAIRAKKSTKEPLSAAPVLAPPAPVKQSRKKIEKPLA